MAANRARRALAVLCLATALHAGAQPGAAEPPPAAPGVDWNTAVEAAWRRSVQAAEAGGRQRLAQADRVAAAAPWAGPPALELEQLRSRQRPDATARETEVALALPLWLPGQRAARLHAADAQAALATAAAAAARLDVARAVREAAWAVWLQRAELESAAIQARELDALAQDVARRVRAGDLARADALSADAERLAGASALAQARLRLQAAEAQWTALTGLVAMPPAAVRPPAPLPASPDDHPLLREAALRAELARRRLEAARLDRREAPELVVRAHHEAATGEPDTRGFGVAIRVPFATADRRQPLIGAALAEAELAEAAEAELRRRLRTELDAAQREEAAARELLDTETARAALLRERAGLIQKSFDAGQTALPEALRALALASQAEAAQRRQAVAAALAAARLQHARGSMP